MTITMSWLSWRARLALGYLMLRLAGMMMDLGAGMIKSAVKVYRIEFEVYEERYGRRG